MENIEPGVKSDNDVFDIRDKLELARLIPIIQFLESVNAVEITSMDGCGNYVKGSKGYESPALSFTPYTINRHREEHGFTHVLWYGN